MAAISIDGTSGTIVPLDKANRPLSNALMYNEPRAGAQAKETQKVMAAHQAKLGLRFGASFSLPRILWIGDNWPDIYEKTALFAHQADYVAGLLCGEYRVSDYSNALKTGYDLLDERWPDQMAQLGLDVEMCIRDRPLGCTGPPPGGSGPRPPPGRPAPCWGRRNCTRSGQPPRPGPCGPAGSIPPGPGP